MIYYIRSIKILIKIYICFLYIDSFIFRLLTNERNQVEFALGYGFLATKNGQAVNILLPLLSLPILVLTTRDSEFRWFCFELCFWFFSSQGFLASIDTLGATCPLDIALCLLLYIHSGAEDANLNAHLNLFLVCFYH